MVDLDSYGWPRAIQPTLKKDGTHYETVKQGTVGREAKNIPKFFFF